MGAERRVRFRPGSQGKAPRGVTRELNLEEFTETVGRGKEGDIQEERGPRSSHDQGVRPQTPRWAPEPAAGGPAPELSDTGARGLSGISVEGYAVSATCDLTNGVWKNILFTAKQGSARASRMVSDVLAALMTSKIHEAHLVF